MNFISLETVLHFGKISLTVTTKNLMLIPFAGGGQYRIADLSYNANASQ